MNKIINAQAEAPPPPPPPAPTETPAAPAKISRKMLYAIIAIVVIVVAIVAGVLLLTGGGGGGGSMGGSIGSASSLQFSATLTGTASDFSYTFYAKNIGTDNLMIRVEGNIGVMGSFTYIVNGAQRKVWMETGNVWNEYSGEEFGTYWDDWGGTLNDYRTNLGSWSGTGDYNYSFNGGNIRVYSIHVNPSLADSLFTH